MARVVVVGASVAGLSPALALNRRGHAVTLLEADAEPGRRPKRRVRESGDEELVFLRFRRPIFQGAGAAHPRVNQAVMM